MSTKFTADDIIGFWFAPEHKSLWFAKDHTFDQKIKENFEAAYQQAARGDFATWQNTAKGALGLILLLDQFPRNLFRASSQAFTTDAKALEIAKFALAQQFDVELNDEQRPFLYMPFMHSESLDDQNRCVELFQTLNSKESAHYAILHRNIIEKFGRFPHRNRVLGRASSPEELEFLKLPNSSF